MVGMTLSLISVLAMLSLYKNMVGISVLSIQDSRQDGQIAIALLTAQNELRNAGFWITATTPDNTIKLLYRAALSSGGSLSGNERSLPSSENTNADSGNALVWIYRTERTATTICAGLLVQGGKLLRLQANSCPSANTIEQWSSLTWTSTTLIEAGQKKCEATDTNCIDFFKAVKFPCWPFGKAASNSSPVKITMRANTSTPDAAGTEPQPAYVKSISEVCLPNLAPSTST